MRKTFKYRLYPNKAQTEALQGQLYEACRLYNAALQERREAYRMRRVSLNYYDQAKQLKEKPRSFFSIKAIRRMGAI